MSTMKVSEQTKKRIGRFRNYPKEPYESVIKRMAQVYEEDLELGEDDIRDIQSSLDDLKEGRINTHEQVKNEFGLK